MLVLRPGPAMLAVRSVEDVDVVEDPAARVARTYGDHPLAGIREKQVVLEGAQIESVLPQHPPDMDVEGDDAAARAEQRVELGAPARCRQRVGVRALDKEHLAVTSSETGIQDGPGRRSREEPRC